ncbi:hypothetical protein ACFL0U_03930 [Pseudomonadota bacterium]
MDNNNTVKYTMNMDSNLHKNLKSFSALNGLNIKDYIISLIKKDMAEKNVCFYGYSHKPNKETQKALKRNKKEEIHI